MVTPLNNSKNENLTNMKQRVLYKSVLFAILCLTVVGIKSENKMHTIRCASYCKTQQNQPGNSGEEASRLYYHNDGFLIRI